jgi:hypothetical protein
MRSTAAVRDRIIMTNREPGAGFVEPVQVVREAKHCLLVAPTPVVLPQVYEGINDVVTSRWWRTLGSDVHFDALPDLLTDGVYRSLIVVTPTKRIPVGLVELIAAEPAHGRAQLSVVSWARGLLRGVTVEGVIVALDEWFATTPVDTVHSMSVADSMAGFGSTLDRLMSFDGCLRKWVRVGGHSHDVRIHSIDAATFAATVRSDRRLHSIAPMWRCLNSDAVLHAGAA